MQRLGTSYRPKITNAITGAVTRPGDLSSNFFQQPLAKITGMNEPVRYLAKGGSVKKGVPVVVGEQGKELFVPKHDGRIIPNEKLGALGRRMRAGKRRKGKNC